MVSYGRMMRVVEEALARLPEDRVAGRVDLLDLRTIVPFDLEGVVDSVRRTGSLLVVNEDSDQTNFGEHLVRVVNEAASPREATFLGARHLPGIGLSQPLEDYTLPSVERVRS